MGFFVVGAFVGFTVVVVEVSGSAVVTGEKSDSVISDTVSACFLPQPQIPQDDELVVVVVTDFSTFSCVIVVIS